MNPADCQLKLQQEYRRETWQELLPQLLPGVEMFAQPLDFPLTSQRERTFATARRQFGRARLADGKIIAFYEIEVSPDVQLLSNRVGLHSLVVRCIDEVSAHAVFAFFAQPGRKIYRLTYAARESKFGENLKVQTEQTTPRRFTYILGEGESCRTAAERFGGLPSAVGIDDLTEAFSVDKLNREFFADFRKAFDVVVKDILARNQGWEHAVAESETQMLLSRLLFLYFIQRKGWLNRQRDYLVSSFNRFYDEDKNGTSFHDKFLRQFFVKLSTEDAFFPNLELGDLPFLNGGLFDDEIGSLTARGRIRIGNSAFRQVFDNLLEAYNFTVREDTPLDQEVAIDPEMLGKIFESLVLQLEQSDMGGKTSRHDTGSYYTPRPIVHYLCREGLRAWLEQFPPAKSADWPVRLEKLFALDADNGIDEPNRAMLNELLTPDEARSLADRLDGFRACDPAVGSGAFLVGLLHELVSLHRICETRSRGKDPAERDSDWLYETKKRIIENVLYGVDIQFRAVEICKLRLWISLMVDYPLEVDPDNCALPDFRKAIKKITPLPNLDFKIRRADSLIEQIRGHAIKFPQTATDSNEFALSLNKLATAKHRFYEARLKKEKRLAQLDALDATAELAQYEFNAAKLKYGLLPGDKDLGHVAELATAEAEMGKLQMQIAVARKKGEREKDDEIERLSRVFNDEAKPTFVWQLDFAEIFHRPSVDVANGGSLSLDPKIKITDVNSKPSGFDLVLANPPYVRQEKIKELKPALKNTFDCYNGLADVFVYFYERGVNLLRGGGVLSFISSNKFFRAGYGEKLRSFLSANTQLQTVIDFGDLPVFEVTAYPCIIVARKSEPVSTHEVKTLNVNTMEELAVFSDLVKTSTVAIPQNSFSENSWQLESRATIDLLEKLRNIGEPLGKYVGGRFYYGIKTGYNEAFVVDRATRDLLIAEHPSSREILKPFLRGRDVKRWSIEGPDYFLCYITWKTKIENFPAIFRHLKHFEEALKARPETKMGRVPWYALSRYASDYWQEFEQPKVVFSRFIDKANYAFDRQGCFINNALWIISRVEPWVAAVLNSPIAWWFLIKHSTDLQNGFIQIFQENIETLGIPQTSEKERAMVTELVEWLLWLHTQPSVLESSNENPRDPLIASYFEQWVNAMIYELYFPTEIHSAGLYFFDLATKYKIPPVQGWNERERLPKIRERLEQIFDAKHPLYAALYTLRGLDIVRSIEGEP